MEGRGKNGLENKGTEGKLGGEGGSVKQEVEPR